MTFSAGKSSGSSGMFEIGLDGGVVGDWDREYGEVPVTAGRTRRLSFPVAEGSLGDVNDRRVKILQEGDL